LIRTGYCANPTSGLPESSSICIDSASVLVQFALFKIPSDYLEKELAIALYLDVLLSIAFHSITCRSSCHQSIYISEFEYSTKEGTTVTRRVTMASSSVEQRTIANLVQTLGEERQRGFIMYSQIQALITELAARDRQIRFLQEKIGSLSNNPASTAPAPANEVPANEVPANEVPAKEAPAKEAPVEDADGSTSIGNKKRKARKRRVANGSVKRQKDGPSHHEIQWDTRFDELVSYKEAHGDCNVPVGIREGFRSLALWVDRQRQKLKKIVDDGNGNASEMEQIQRFHSVGFVFQKPLRQLPFEERMKQLLEFKAKTGHCNTHYAQYSNDCPKGLVSFVLEQRKYYGHRKAGKRIA
jgi:hypothetical protein